MDKETQLEKINAAFDTMFDDACAENSQYTKFFPKDCIGIIFDAENSKRFPCTLRLEFEDHIDDYVINVEKV